MRKTSNEPLTRFRTFFARGSENNVPAGCWRDNIAYDAFNALTDWKYSDPHNMTLSKMKLVVPVTSTDVGWLKDVHEILSPFHNEEVGGGKLVAWDTKIKFLLFTVVWIESIRNV